MGIKGPRAEIKAKKQSRILMQVRCQWGAWGRQQGDFGDKKGCGGVWRKYNTQVSTEDS